jgi:hypothetical protein
VNIVFFAIGHEYVGQAEMAAEAARLTNPHARLFLITDQTSAVNEDVLESFRVHTSKPTLMYDRTLAQHQFLRKWGHAIFLDSDCVVNGPLSEDVFPGPVSVTKRVPPDGIETQVYNGGVLYGEGKDAVKFWQDWVDMYPQLERRLWAWWGDQLVLPLLVEQYKPNIFPSETHNFIPWMYSQCENRIDAHIVHFKGERRKAWMPIYIETLKRHYGTENLHRSAEYA